MSEIGRRFLDSYAGRRQRCGTGGRNRHVAPFYGREVYSQKGLGRGASKYLQNIKIYCPFAQPLKKNQYGQYLLRRAEEDVLT